jgi:hypothetical protein
MDLRRWSQRAEWGLVATVVALHATVFFGPEDPSNPNFLLTAAHDAQLLSAIVLIVGWVVLGPGRLLVRLLAAPVLVCLWFLPWNSAMQPREISTGFIGTLFCVAVVLSGGLRVCGLRIARRSASEGPERGAQFSLFALLLATTVIAVAIGLLETLRPRLREVRPGDLWAYPTLLTPSLSDRAEQVRHMAMAASVGLSALGGLWVVLRPGAIWVRLAATSVLIATGGFYFAHLAGADIGLTDNSLFWTTGTSLAFGLASVAVLCGLSVLPLRLMGFRLQQPAAVANQIEAPAQVRMRLAARVAATLLLGAAVALLALKSREANPSHTAINGRINVNSSYWLLLSGLGAVDEIQPPIRAFAEWIDGRSISTLRDTIWLDTYFRFPNRGRFVELYWVAPVVRESILEETNDENKSEQP